jgi:hypothetical protein
MMTLFEDLRLALRQMCQAIGLSGTAASVVPLVVLGVALNVIALSTTDYVRVGGHSHRSHDRMALRNAARTEMKVVKAVLTSTFKKIGSGQRRWCLTEVINKDRRIGVVGDGFEVGFAWAIPSTREGCNVTIMGGSDRKMATALVEC